ncbi:MAG: metal ABC transporter substrate-binding protein [Planctomycetota bacterium]
MIDAKRAATNRSHEIPRRRVSVARRGGSLVFDAFPPTRSASWSALFFLCVGLAPMTACSRSDSEPKKNQRLNLLCTFLPVYLHTLNVVGNDPTVSIHLLVPSDAGCPHQYAVRQVDLKRISHADVVIANGLGMEPFLDELLKANPAVKVISLSDDCDAIQVATHHHDDHESHEHGHDKEVNGHVWVSPLQAAKQVRALGQKLGVLDPSRATQYAENATAFAARLEAVGSEMKAAAATFARRKIVCFHDAFAYLARDLSLEVVATFVAEAEESVSAQQMVQLVETIRSTKAAAIFFEPGTSERTARTVGLDAGVPVFPLNPVSAVKGAPHADSYERIMRENTATLRQALGVKP